MSKLSALQRKAFDAYDAALANYATAQVALKDRPDLLGLLEA
jgi:hypothetical protein